ncbi:MAG: hypothetical protein NTZ90_10800 [Proteobacteria bacterium]|nr:hypothetical protein [Pseudomonadota bacterium]
MPKVQLQTAMGEGFDTEIDATAGVTIIYGQSIKIVSWDSVRIIIEQATKLAQAKKLKPGMSEDAPPAGSLGDFVQTHKPGGLTPRHLSHLGPVLAHIGIIKRVSGKKPVWWELW